MHLSNCRGERITRHNGVVEAYRQCMAAAGIQNIKMEMKISSNDPDNRKRGDLTFLGQTPKLVGAYNATAFDVTVRQAYSEAEPQPHLRGCTKTIITKGIKEKTNKYGELCRKEHTRFIPLVMTSFGAYSKESLDFFRELEIIAQNNKLYFPQIDRKLSIILRENVSFALARQNCRAASKCLRENLSRN